jgi:hypothetical protein
MALSHCTQGEVQNLVAYFLFHYTRRVRSAFGWQLATTVGILSPDGLLEDTWEQH